MLKKNIFIVFFFSLLSISSIHAADKKNEICGKIISGDMKSMKKMIFKNPDLVSGKYGTAGQSLIQIALENNAGIEIIKELIMSGVEIEAADINGETSIITACKYNVSPDILDLLVKSSAITAGKRMKNVLMADKTGNTAFFYCSKNEKLLEVLTRYAENPESGVREVKSVPEKEKSKKKTPVSEPGRKDLPVKKDAPPVTQSENSALEKKSVESNGNEDDKKPALLSVSSASEYRPVYLFEGLPLFIDQPDEKINEVRMMKDPDRQDKSGKTQLMKAAANDDVRIMTQLINAGADVNLKDKNSWNALMYASRFGEKKETVEILLNSGADPLVKNTYGITPAEIAAVYNESVEIIGVMLLHSDPLIIKKSFISAILKQRKPEVIKAIIDCGANVNGMLKGKTALMYAAANNTDTDIIRLLLDHGADISISDADGKVAFDYALKNPNLPHDGNFWTLNGK